MSIAYYPKACLEEHHKIVIHYTLDSQSNLALLEYKEYTTCSHSVHQGYTMTVQCHTLHLSFHHQIPLPISKYLAGSPTLVTAV